MAKRIVVIDDDENFLDLMRMVLEGEGYEVLTLSHATDAPARVKEWQPDLILLDLKMPERGGWEVLELLRLDPSARRIPIVFTTAAADEVRATEPLTRQWKVESLFKPFEMADLLAKVEGLIGKAA